MTKGLEENWAKYSLLTSRAFGKYPNARAAIDIAAPTTLGVIIFPNAATLIYDTSQDSDNLITYVVSENSNHGTPNIWEKSLNFLSPNDHHSRRTDCEFQQNCKWNSC